MRVTTISIVVLGLLIGAAAGLGAYTFVYAKGYSYLTNDPAACANCHVMNDYYAGWVKGTHRAAAVCNDCHTPHDLAGKYATKASNGFWHSFYFTTGHYPDNLEIRPSNAEVTEGACRHCHQEIVLAITAHPARAEEERFSCVRCHDGVGHMR
ncbi:MAG TPA: cytochrome c nitrite reductase small subunit [Thermoanaerobaculia bacterium]|nr:cytochrome c nitrite reductase small subunit [Thermoanaerobaculia bacterium]